MAGGRAGRTGGPRGAAAPRLGCILFFLPLAHANFFPAKKPSAKAPATRAMVGIPDGVVLSPQLLQLQLSPHWQSAPQVQVPLALALQGPAPVPQHDALSPQLLQLQVSPHWQSAPQVQVPAALALQGPAPVPQESLRPEAAPSPGQSTQAQFAPHWQLVPQLQFPAATALHFHRHLSPSA